MNPRPVSRLNRGGGDRLSELPDPIRLHILSFLPIKDAILTTLLSKAWINFWSQLPTLVFAFEYDTSDKSAIHAFTHFIDKALIFHNSQHLDTFGVSFDFFAHYHEKQAHSWIRFAVNRNVKHVQLIFDRWSDDQEIDTYCSIPSFLLQSDVLVSLNLKYCRLTTFVGELQCKSLTSLLLNSCGLGDNLVSKLLVGCPVLETLQLIDCQGIINLAISHDGLKVLVIKHDIWQCGYNGTLRISAPHLTSLSLYGRIYSKFQLGNLSSLVEAFIDVECPPLSLSQGLMDNNVLARMSNVKKLTLGSRCIEALSLLDTTHPPFQVPSCKSLVLHLRMSRSNFGGVAWLLRSCCQLETLTLNAARVWPTSSTSSNNYQTWASFFISQVSCGYPTFVDHLKNVNVMGAAPHHP